MFYASSNLKQISRRES